MQISEYLDIKRNQDFIIKIIKIILLGFVSFSLFASAIPFYLGYDDVNYGISAIHLSEGHFGITNELLRETDYEPGGAYYQFVPNAYVETERGVAIPKSSIGIHALGSFFYFIGGIFGLLYFGPIVTIALLILFERISTKFFGSLVGLMALLFIAADWQIFFVGLRFLTDNIFSLFFILGVFSMIKFLNQKNDRYILLSSTFFTISTLFRISGIVFFPIEIFVLASYFVLPHLKKKFIFNRNKSYSKVILKKQIFSKSNFKNFLKINSFLFIPWIIFLVFWFSFNAYYFGDIETNYQDQMRNVSIDDDEQRMEINKPSEEVLRNNYQRLQLVQYYSVPLLPDPLYFFSVITSDTDLDVWRSDIWISYITFSILSIVLIFSLYFKIKRKETLVLLLFIFGIVIFYSSPLVSDDPLASNLSEHANNRYTIPISLLSFTLIGFILVEGWCKCFPKNHALYNKILHPVKLIYLILVIAFFLVLIVTMPSIQDFYQTGFHFNNPFLAAKSFEDLEQLPEKSFIVGYAGRNTLLHTDTHFYPYGRNFILEEGDVSSIPKSKLLVLTKLVEEGYVAYAFKNNMFIYDKKYFEFLETEYGLVLKDHSKTFCKLELISNLNEDIDGISSDPTCFEDIIEGDKKLWDVTLKWPP